MEQRTAPTRSVGVLGLGVMGRPIAENLVAAGFDVTVWSRRESASRGLGEDVTVADGASGMRGLDILSVLPDVDQLEEIASREVLRLWQQNGTRRVVIMSTSSPDKVRAFALSAKDAGISVVDAPMSGGDKGARDATMSLMVGGTVGDFDELRPVFDAIAGSVLRFGDVGAGTIAKLCNQIVVGSTLAGLAQAFALARSEGLDLAKLSEVFGGGLAGSRVLSLKEAKLVDRDYSLGGSALNQLKDMRYAEDALAAGGVRSDVVALLTALFTESVQRGHGAQDHSVVQELFLTDPIGA